MFYVFVFYLRLMYFIGWSHFIYVIFDPSPSANHLKLRALLRKGHVNSPDERVILQICKSAYNLDLACSSTAYALDIYQDYKNLPKTFTCNCITDSLGITVKKPAFGDAKPLIMCAIGAQGEPLIVKLLRIDPDASSERKLLLDMEIQACEVLNLSDKSKGISLIQAKIADINLPEPQLNIYTQGRMKAIVMPRYATTIAQSSKFPIEVIAREGRKILEALKFMHDRNIVHMDVKGDNMLLDWNGNWLLGDFDSCRFIGEAILSTTEMFYHSRLSGTPAHPRHDYFMLLVVLIIESLPKKRNFVEVLFDADEERVSLAKVKEMAGKPTSSENFRQLLREIVALV